MAEKMGFESQPKQFESYGKAGEIEIDGRTLWTQSKVERQWLQELELAIRAGRVVEWEWQPPAVLLAYKYDHQEATETYRPDARVAWVDEGEFWYEIKNGRIEQKAGNKIKRFCQQNPDKRLVLVWKGKAPKPATEKKQKHRRTTKTQWDRLQAWVHHVWYLK
jgi:hypothetical protein